MMAASRVRGPALTTRAVMLSDQLRCPTCHDLIYYADVDGRAILPCEHWVRRRHHPACSAYVLVLPLGAGAAHEALIALAGPVAARAVLTAIDPVLAPAYARFLLVQVTAHERHIYRRTPTPELLTALFREAAA